MDREAKLALELIVYFIVACLISTFLGSPIIGFFIKRLSEPFSKYQHTDPFHPKLAGSIGRIERLMYIMCILIGRPEFIAVWIVLKAAGEWRRDVGESMQRGAITRPLAGARPTQHLGPGQQKQTEEVDQWVGISARYTVFLMGNALSIMLGVGLALALQSLLPPFPSLSHWALPTF